jgi:DNA-binding CsgD family transcriptional regulator/tetratricopeptide (TPR) repeat protein
MNSTLIGRDAEIAEILSFISATGTPAAVIITGDTGIGKTAVWQRMLQASPQSSRVLSCRPALAERPLAFSALNDLFGEVAGEVLPMLPGPRRRSVEVALLRDVSPQFLSPGMPGVDPGPPARRVLAQGILDMLRILSVGTPLVLAVDDAQWLDRPSARVLEFGFRRLQSECISILMTFRGDGQPSLLGLDTALPPDRLNRVRLGPLSLGAIGEILRSQRGLALPRYELTRLYETCGGNPFYALECARMLIEHPQLSVTNEPIPIPRSLSELVRHRVRQLMPDVRRVGQLAAASSRPREGLIRAACDDRESWSAIDLAVDAGLIERSGEMLRFTHPLLRSVLYSEMPLNERRRVHQRLGAVAEDIEERAWHVALGADRPSEEVAGLLDDAARHAASRGAPGEGATFTEHAARLTPAGRRDAVRKRMVCAADYRLRAGDLTRSRELIQSAVTACPAGPPRAQLLLRLATIYYHQSGWPLAEQTFQQAAEDAADEPALRAHAEQELAFARLVAGDLRNAARLAKTSLRSAEQAADPRLIAHSLARIALFEFLQGNGAQPDLLERAEALAASVDEEPIGRLPMLNPLLATGLVLKWSDRLDEARQRLAARYRHALDAGDEPSLPYLLYHLSELECWAGNWDTAEEYALEGCRVADENRLEPMRPATLYSLVLVRAHRGQVENVRDLASEALALCDRTGNVPLTSLIVSVLGFLALSLDDNQGAHSHLGRLAETATSVGLGEPSVAKFLPNDIEALIALGQTSLARSLTQQLQARGMSLGRRWALATGARCRAYLAAVDGDLPAARAACQQALVEHEMLPMPFELGRTLLIKGMIDRRAKHKSAAKESISQALGIFGQLGAPLWADKAQRELSKTASHAPTNGLTETEHRIAALVARGQTNREIAAAMFVTENTVQTHVQHIFQKLGTRSRTELTARLLSAHALTTTATSPPDR